MRKDLVLEPWKILSQGQAQDDFLESIFFLGNGRIGIRGYLPIGREKLPIKTGMYAAGIFGEIKPKITDIVNLPTPVFEQILIDGETAVVEEPVTRELDLRNAVFTTRFGICKDDKKADVLYQRFFPRDHTGLCMQRMVLKPKQKMHLQIRSGIYMTSCNCPIPDDQTKENIDTIQLSSLFDVKRFTDGFSCSFRITGTDLSVEEQLYYRNSMELALIQAKQV